MSPLIVVILAVFAAIFVVLVEIFVVLVAMLVVLVVIFVSAVVSKSRTGRIFSVVWKPQLYSSKWSN